MSTQDTTRFGKRIELQIENELLDQGYDVYLPMMDDHGVDCVVKKSDGAFIQIQIKGRSEGKPGNFHVDDHENPIDDFYFIFYSEGLKKTWLFSSKEFCDNTKPTVSGKHIRRKIKLFTPKGTVKKFEKYIIGND